MLASLVHLDGSGAVTFLVTVPAMLPLYERLGMDRRVLAAAAALGAGVMNVLPWGGPTLRAAGALKVPVAALYRPLVPVQLCGLLFALALCWWLGRRETRRLVERGGTAGRDVAVARTLTESERALRRPGRLWINVALTVAVLGLMIASVLPPVAMFMLGTAAALLDQLSVGGDAARTRGRARARRAHDGEHPARGGRVHRDHAGDGDDRRDGVVGGGVRAARRGGARAVRARRRLDAAEPPVRSRLVLLRRAARGRRDDEDARRGADGGGARRIDGTDDGRISR